MELIGKLIVQPDNEVYEIFVKSTHLDTDELFNEEFKESHKLTILTFEITNNDRIVFSKEISPQKITPLDFVEYAMAYMESKDDDYIDDYIMYQREMLMYIYIMVVVEAFTEKHFKDNDDRQQTINFEFNPN